MEKQFVSKVNPMAKAIITVGYTEYVLDAQDALTILELIGSAEVYKAKYASASEGGSTHHVWECMNTDPYTLKLLPDNLYRMAKLAGKPAE